MKKWTLSYFLIFIVFIAASCSKMDDPKEPNYTENSAPTCMITSPLSDALYAIGDTIPIKAVGEDSDGTISRLVFYIDGIEKSSLSASPYIYNWITDSMTIGTHVITCEAFDNNYAHSSTDIEINLEKATSFTDSRDGQSYQTLCIGNQVWMAENLNYNNPAYFSIENIEGYGRLYKWVDAMEACPTGWHLPSDDEWKLLELNLGMPLDEVDLEGFRGSDQGKQMKDTTSWWENMDGFNASGFSGKANGSTGQIFEAQGAHQYGVWWTSTEGDTTTIACIRWLNVDSIKVGRYFEGKGFGYSVRCVKD